MIADFAAEIDGVTATARGFAQRHDVSVAERLPHERRMALLLTAIAEAHANSTARGAASDAWRRVRELQEVR